MENNLIGAMLVQLRKDKKMTQQDIADHLYCTREYVSLMENNKRGLASIHIIPLSQLLEFNFNIYLRNNHRFKCISHYMLAYELMDLVTNAKYKEIESILENNPLMYEFNYHSTVTLKTYLQSMVSNTLYNDYKASEDALLKLLNINSREGIKHFNPIISSEDRYYSCINLLACTLIYQNEFDYALTILTKAYDLIGKMYFTTLTPKSSVSSYFQRIYILIMNNLADVLFTQGKYNNSLELCNEAITIFKDFEIIYIAELILKLKIENLCCLDKLDEAKKDFDQLRHICEFKDCNNYYEETKQQFIIKYPKLFQD